MAYFPTTYNLALYEGDTVDFDVTYKEGDEGAEVGIALTGSTLLCQIREDATDVATAAVFTVTADADQVTNPGLMNVVLDETNAELLTGGTAYVYDLEITWANGNIQTIIRGAITVEPGVSR